MKRVSLNRLFPWPEVPVLTRTRIGFAFAVAVVIDAAQIGLGPLGWVLVDQALDVLGMVLISGALGFHLLLLPTFVLELLPVSDWLPTWTGCTVAVVMLRKQTQRKPPPPIIEVQSKVTQEPPPPSQQG